MSHMPPVDWFLAWVRSHCVVTAADAAVAETILANRSAILDGWRATEDELQTVTERLVLAGRMPRFPNEHVPAIGEELTALRGERQAIRDAERLRAYSETASGPRCSLCGDTGLVTVPHHRCVWHGRLVLHPVNGVLYTCAVICLCDGGRDLERREDERCMRASESDLRKRPRMANLDGYTRSIGGHDGVYLILEHEREQARRARSSDDGQFCDLFPNLAKRIAEKAVAS